MLPQHVIITLRCNRSELSAAGHIQSTNMHTGTSPEWPAGNPQQIESVSAVISAAELSVIKVSIKCGAIVVLDGAPRFMLLLNFAPFPPLLPSLQFLSGDERHLTNKKTFINDLWRVIVIWWIKGIRSHRSAMRQPIGP